MQSDAVASRLANGSAAFIWKLHCHWLRGLRQCQIVEVRQTPDFQNLDAALQAITKQPSVDHMVSLGHNELTIYVLNFSEGA